jgi:hypothetical protein
MNLSCLSTEEQRNPANIGQCWRHLPSAAAILQYNKLRRIRREGAKVVHEDERASILCLYFVSSPTIKTTIMPYFYKLCVNFAVFFRYSEKNLHGTALINEC